MIQNNLIRDKKKFYNYVGKLLNACAPALILQEPNTGRQIEDLDRMTEMFADNFVTFYAAENVCFIPTVPVEQSTRCPNTIDAIEYTPAK